MKLTLVLSFVVLLQLKCFDSSRNVGVAISKVIEIYYVKQHLTFDFIVKADSSEMNVLLDGILSRIKHLATPAIIKIND